MTLRYLDGNPPVQLVVVRQIDLTVGPLSENPLDAELADALGGFRAWYAELPPFGLGGCVRGVLLSRPLCRTTKFGFDCRSARRNAESPGSDIPTRKSSTRGCFPALRSDSNCLRIVSIRSSSALECDQSEVLSLASTVQSPWHQ